MDFGPAKIFIFRQIFTYCNSSDQTNLISAHFHGFSSQSDICRPSQSHDGQLMDESMASHTKEECKIPCCCYPFIMLLRDFFIG